MITTAIMTHTKAFPAGEEKVARVSVTAWCTRPVWAGSLPGSWAADLGERSVTVCAALFSGRAYQQTRPLSHGLNAGAETLPTETAIRCPRGRGRSGSLGE